MKKLLLISGDGGHGKTYLTRNLGAQYDYEPLELDPLYIKFIKSNCSILYFDALNLYIGPHYDSILVYREYSKEHLGRDFIAEWHSHVMLKIKALIEGHDNVVVEGYLLRDFKDELELELKDYTNVFQIEVKDRCYYFGERILTMQEIAELEIDDPAHIPV